MYALFRTYPDSLHTNLGVETLLYLKTPDNSTASVSENIAYQTFVPTSCEISVGDTSEGITGTLTEFRVFYGTGVIPGLNQAWDQDCAESVGLIKGTHDPCFLSCSDINCIACRASAAICTACNSNTYLYSGVSPPVCQNSCPYGYIADATNRVCTQCSASGKFVHNNICVTTCPAGWGSDTSSVCINCVDSGKYSYNNLCESSCPTGFGPDSSSNCVDCSTLSKYFYNGLCVSTCPGGMGGTTDPNICVSCADSGEVSVNGFCESSCPAGYGADSNSDCAVQCSLNGTYSYNRTCVESCPYGHTADASQHACVKCPGSQYFFNHTCLASCPARTFANTYIYECEPCFLGCEACTSTANTECSACSEGYYLEIGYCLSGCPPSKYENPVTRTCDDCQPPCVTCSQPNSSICTSCHPNFFLVNGDCVSSCPSTHYAGMLGDSSLYEVPACLLRLGLEFKLALAPEAHVIYINFNYSISSIVLAITQIIQVEIGNVQLDSASYALTPVTDSQLKFQYLGNQYHPAQSLLRVTLDLETCFNNDPYQKFIAVTKSATIHLKEIYPFGQTERNVITATSAITESTGAAIAGSQVTASVATGALSSSLIRMQIIGEIVQMLRFIEILWPPNVQVLFAETKYNPTNIEIKIDLITSWNQNLEDFNSSMPRVFEEYEVDAFFTQNFNYELSNFLVVIFITIPAAIVFGFSRKLMQKLTNKLKPPKTNAKKGWREHAIVFLHALSRLLNRVEIPALLNFTLFFILSIYQPGSIWSLVNINYYSTLLDPPTSYTKATFVFAIICIIMLLLLTALVFYAVISNFKYVIKNSLRPSHTKPYQTLFNDFNNKNKWQLLFVPFSLVRSLVYAITITFLNSYPLAQIIIICSVTGIFVLYYIVKKPLKHKWTNRFTLVMELFGFGCMTIGVVLGLSDKYFEIDPTTRNEIGYAFITFTMTSTLAGGLLTLIQVLELIVLIYRYIRDKRRQRLQVKPVNLEELHQTTETQIVFRRKTSPKSELKMSISTNPLDRFEKLDNSIKHFGSLSAQTIAQSPQGLQILEDLEKWYQKQQPSNLNNTKEIAFSPTSGKLLTGPRITLFAEDYVEFSPNNPFATMKSSETLFMNPNHQYS